MARHIAKALDDLIISCFLKEFEINQLNKQKGIKVPIAKEKISYLTDYLELNHLTDLVEPHPDGESFFIHHCLMLELKLREWTKEGEVIAINPAQLKISTLLLWASLFAERREFSVVVPTTMNEALQQTFVHLFSLKVENGSLLSNGRAFQINEFLNLFMLSIRYNRPVMETGELSYLLSDKDKRRLRKIMLEMEEGGIRNA